MEFRLWGVLQRKIFGQNSHTSRKLWYFLNSRDCGRSENLGGQNDLLHITYFKKDDKGGEGVKNRRF